jgi:hypothetical protein
LLFAARAFAQTAPPADAQQPAPAAASSSATATSPSAPPLPADSSSQRQRERAQQSLLPPPPLPPRESASDPLSRFLYGLGMITARFNGTLYGFAEFDLMYDTTQSFNDSVGNGVLARADGATKLAGTHDRFQMTARNSRIGFKLTAPEWHKLRATALIEGDFFGNQPPTATEAQLFNNGTFRIRHAYTKIENPWVEVLGGQYYGLFGWQPFFFPVSVEFLQIPNMIFGRTPQLRLSHAFKTRLFNFDIAAAILRPPQRDAARPDMQAALRFQLNPWKGAHSAGSGYAVVDPLTISISGALRYYRVNEFAAAPMDYRHATGWGVSVDAMVPIVPAKSPDDKGNALTAIGSFVRGSGDADLYGLTGGAAFPALPALTMGATPPAYNGNVDPGVVQFDPMGNLRTINWQSFIVCLQYYLPPKGRIFIAGDYSQSNSNNIARGVTGAALGKLYTQSQYVEVNLFVDITVAVRTAAAWEKVIQTMGDGARLTDDRFIYALYYFF